MPYAHNGSISQDPIPGGIEITPEQYQEALDGMKDGLEVTIDGGFKVAPKPDPVIPPPQTKTQLLNVELSALSAAYKADLQSLQMSWLSAAVAGGISEETKKEGVQADMADSKAQYLLDVAETRAKYA